VALGWVALLASARSSNLFKGSKYRGGASPPPVVAVVGTEGKFEAGALLSSTSGEVKGIVTAYGNTDARSSAKLLDACFGTGFSKAGPGSLVDAASVESCLILNCAAQESACFASNCADVVLLSAWGDNGASAVR
jgi:hypothetical protein